MTMRTKRSAQQARRRRDRNRRLAKLRNVGPKMLRCEPLEMRTLLDAAGLLPGILPPDGTDPVPPLEPGAVSGRVWEDTDGDHQYNGAELGMGGVTVYSDLNFNGIHEDFEPSTVTSFDDPVTDFDEGGLYTLDNLQPGYHNLRQITPSGFEQTFPYLPDGFLPPPWGDPSVHVTFVDSGQSVSDLDFGNREIQPGAVSGVKWEDVNGNAERDPDELGLPGVIIYSDVNQNGVLDPDEPQTVTSEDDPTTDFDESGQYVLTGLNPGLHWIKEVVPDGFQQTFPNYWLFAPPVEPGDILLPPDGFFPGQPAHDVLIRSGETIDGLDFGNQRILPASVSGVKWEDTNGNAERDPDELGLPGVIIFSDTNLNGVLDPDEPQTVTSEDDPTTDFDESGLYTLTNLEPGWHWIKEVVPDGYRQTFPRPFPQHVLGPDGQIPDILPPPVGGTPHDVFLQSGQSIDGIDFGNQLIVPGSIHGVKWEDANGDGVRDNDEPGLPGVTIYIDVNFNAQLDPDEPSAVTMRDDPNTDFDESGLYWLDVDPGFHLVREVVPDGFRQTFPQAFFPAPWLDPLDPAIGILPPADGAHYVTVEPGQAVEGIDFGNQRVVPGTISGVKWEDANGNAEFDPGERGLAGVTIYADLNGNGVFDADEPSAVTTADIPETDFDEAGRYTLTGLEAGHYIIREVVPDGFRQTFPVDRIAVPGDTGGGIVDEFATVEPERLDLVLAAGEVTFADVAITVHPNLFRPLELDVVASSADVELINLSGIQPNGGGGDVSVFQMMVVATNVPFAGELLFVDQFDGNIVASIPLTINVDIPGDGAHRVTLEPGQSVDGIDFGNQRTAPETGSVSGRKWADLNGNGEREFDEPGLPGVTMYVDLNFNARLDPGEPRTVTQRDIPETDFDEAGLYDLSVPVGFQAIREVVPRGFQQTFPISDAASPLEQGAHFVDIAANQHVDGLDFGNQPLEVFSASVSGTVWEELQVNSERDPNEPGIGGVTVYSDLNFNAQFDEGEPHAVTKFDIPETDFDEGGLYSIGDLVPGVHVIRQVVPDGMVQIYPSSLLAIPNSDAHTVDLAPGDHRDGLDFGNLRFGIPLPGDFNSDGVVDGRDEAAWEVAFGGNVASAATTADVGEPMNGASFLTWQRHYGSVSTLEPNDSSANGATFLEWQRDFGDSAAAAVSLTGIQQETAPQRTESNTAVVEAVFAESAPTEWRASEASFSRAALWAFASVDDGDDREDAETIDAALAAAFSD